ncbi:M20/M25/M40 family metallo-hydrolase [Actinomadura sp. DC4]|uniref:M20/M25/M40 family metallo-hydrolase n=1 Tax=Actinomadura sp. DC4 TaxID=3055069 RepID=UPI0025B2065E|nr:M20/M25/M40 family metallo-hydrolase [Actinomadura sp. DC4]MDN3353636.1 M20/M25/M40 family metallo-hydrolase [Actinomadura sp. DC4]
MPENTLLRADGPALLESATARLPRLIGDVGRLVAVESPSSDLAAVARSADTVAAVGAAHLGAPPERLMLDGRTHLRWRFGPGPSRVLVLGHHDTVWPVGSLAVHPFSAGDGTLRGPGCLDMKTGLAMAFDALAALADPSGVCLLVTGDEELGSPSSRALIEEEAAGCDAVLVLEAAAGGGALKVERKGRAGHTITIAGRAAHAGLEPEKGVNAGVELAHQVLACTALADEGEGTTVTASLLAAGTSINTVPDAASFTVDVRARSRAELERVDRAVHGLRPRLPGARVTAEGGVDRMPLERSASADLFALAADAARTLGLPALRGAAVGGGSDGNLTAALGVPTLDGLGAVGDGAHAAHEHVLLDELPGRLALLAVLLDRLLRRTPTEVTR